MLFIGLYIFRNFEQTHRLSGCISLLYFLGIRHCAINATDVWMCFTSLFFTYFMSLFYLYAYVYQEILSKYIGYLDVFNFSIFMYSAQNIKCNKYLNVFHFSIFTYFPSLFFYMYVYLEILSKCIDYLSEFHFSIFCVFRTIE